MNKGYLILDTETTGFFPQKNGLIQLAAVITDKYLNIVDTFNFDVKPPSKSEITKESLEVTGFTIDRIHNGLSYKDVSQKFFDFLSKYFSTENKPVVVGQFYPFDYAFLQEVFVASGFEKKLCQDLLQNDFIDTKVLVNFANLIANKNNIKIPFESTSLSKPGGLKDKLKIDKNKFTAHDALGDVLATLEVLKILTEKFNIINLS